MARVQFYLYFVALFFPLMCMAYDPEMDSIREKSHKRMDSLKRAFVATQDWNELMKIIKVSIWQMDKCMLNPAECRDVASYFLSEVKAKRKTNKLLPYIQNALGFGYYPELEARMTVSDYFLSTLEHIEATKDAEWVSKTYQHIGYVLYTIGDYSGSLKYFMIFEKNMWKIPMDKGLLVSAYNTIGLIFQKKEDINNAIAYYNKGLEEAKAQGHTTWIGILSGNIGSLYYKQQKYDEALRMLEIDVKFSIENKIIANAILSLCDIILIHIDQKRLEEAKKRLEQADELIKKVEKIPVDLNAYAKYYETTATYYENIRDFEKSTHFRKLYEEMDRDFKKHIKDAEIQRIKFRYNYEKKQRDVEELTKQNETQQAYLYTISLSLLAVVLLIVVLGQRYYQKNVLMNQLTVQHEHIKQINEELLQQATIIDQQNTALQASNASKDKIFTLISHDLRSPLASVKGVISLLENNLLSVEELQSILPTITSNIDHTLNLSEELLYWATSQMQGIQTNLASVNPKYIANQNFLIFTENAQKKKVHLIEDIAVNIPNVWADENMSKTILRNLVANALKFSKEGGSITIIATQQDENFIKLGVKDTGVGIKAENLPKIFSDEPFTTKGTAGEKGTGFGLMLCKDFVTQNGGKIWVESEWEKGTTFFFTLPIDKNTQASQDKTQSL